MAIDLLVILLVGLCMTWCAWLANDMLWDRWQGEKDAVEARRLTWLIALNLTGAVAGGTGLLVLALRTSIW